MKNDPLSPGRDAGTQASDVWGSIDGGGASADRGVWRRPANAPEGGCRSRVRIYECFEIAFGFERRKLMPDPIWLDTNTLIFALKGDAAINRQLSGYRTA